MMTGIESSPGLQTIDILIITHPWTVVSIFGKDHHPDDGPTHIGGSK